MSEVVEGEVIEKTQEQPAPPPPPPPPQSREVSLRDKVTDLSTGGELLGVNFRNVAEILDFAQVMAKADSAVPPHCRGNPGNCLAIITRAVEWKMSPFAVANLSYEVENKGVKRIAYESQLYHAVLEARGPFIDRLHYEIIGEGEERRCKVWATLRGESEPRVFLSDTLAKLRPPKNDYGKTKGSPLWDSKPEVQLFYNASRDFARIYCPDVMAGIYTNDEMEEAKARHEGPQFAKDVTPAAPTYRQRLQGRTGRDGFSGQENISRSIDDALSAARGKPVETETRADEATPNVQANSDALPPTTAPLPPSVSSAGPSSSGDVIDADPVPQQPARAAEDTAGDVRTQQQRDASPAAVSEDVIEERSEPVGRKRK